MSRGMFHCKHCGIRFDLTSEDNELYNDGLIDKPDQCEKCAREGEYEEYESFSDADPGL